MLWFAFGKFSKNKTHFYFTVLTWIRKYDKVFLADKAAWKIHSKRVIFRVGRDKYRWEFCDEHKTASEAARFSFSPVFLQFCYLPLDVCECC